MRGENDFILGGEIFYYYINFNLTLLLILIFDCTVKNF